MFPFSKHRHLIADGVRASSSASLLQARRFRPVLSSLSLAVNGREPHLGATRAGQLSLVSSARHVEALHGPRRSFSFVLHACDEYGSSPLSPLSGNPVQISCLLRVAYLQNTCIFIILFCPFRNPFLSSRFVLHLDVYKIEDEIRITISCLFYVFFLRRMTSNPNTISHLPHPVQSLCSSICRVKFPLMCL